MEEILKTLEKIGINDQIIAGIKAAGDTEEARAYALMLIAMYDDRHEYV